MDCFTCKLVCLEWLCSNFIYIIDNLVIKYGTCGTMLHKHNLGERRNKVQTVYYSQPYWHNGFFYYLKKKKSQKGQNGADFDLDISL